jgi:hypothetical protein
MPSQNLEICLEQFLRAQPCLPLLSLLMYSSVLIHSHDPWICGTAHYDMISKRPM